jgi:hypothetical protein
MAGAEDAAQTLGYLIVDSSVRKDTDPIYRFVFDARGPERSSSSSQANRMWRGRGCLLGNMRATEILAGLREPDA